MLQQPFYDPGKTFQENYNHGPWGPFANGGVYEQVGEPKHDFFGRKVYLPFGISSGPLFNSKFINAALEKGFDIVLQKTVRSRHWEANPFPNIIPIKVKGNLLVKEQKAGVLKAADYSEPLTIVNSFGNPSFSPDIWQPDLKKSLTYIKKGQVLACAIEGTTNEGGSDKEYLLDWVRTAKLVRETGVDIIEVNTSCPNQGAADLLCFDIKKSQIILDAVKNEVGNAKVFVKLAYFENKNELKKLVEALGKIVDGISAINTMPTKVVNESGDLAVAGRPIAGACGDGVRWAGLEMVKSLKMLREEFKMNYSIVGVGGVSNAKHYQTYIEAGSDAVMAATGAIWNPFLAQEIKLSAVENKQSFRYN